MRLLACRVGVGLVAFVAGVIAVEMWSARFLPQRTLEFPSNQPTSPYVLPNSIDDESLEASFTNGNRMVVDGFEITRTFDRANSESRAYIKKNGKLLATHRSGGGISEDTTRIGLFPFLGDGRKQLVIEQYSGGAHCCWSYWIYQLTPDFRLIFDSSEYDVGYQLRPIDLDEDGRYEFIQSVMAFDYFHMSHASSPFPDAVFEFDPKIKAYRPANLKYPDYVLKGLSADLQQVDRLNTKVDSGNEEQEFSSVLQVLLKYVYAGRENEGWSYYAEKYRAADKAPMKYAIKTALRGDPVYRSIY